MRNEKENRQYLGLQTSWQNFSTELLFKIFPWKFHSQ